MALRIAFNASALLAPLTGIGNYIVQLGAALAAEREADLWAFYAGLWRAGPPEVPAHQSRSLLRPAMQGVRRSLATTIPFKREIVRWKNGASFGRGLWRHAIDLYHEPNYVPMCWDVPVVVSIHDLSWMHYPDAHPRDRIRWLERGVPRALRDAAAILVDSEFVRDEVRLKLGASPSRVHVAALGVSGEFRPRTANETRTALQALGLTHGEYLLTVGTLEPRKNIRHTIDAHSILPSRIRDRFPLVIAGASGWGERELRRDLRSLGHNGRVRFVGHVSASYLPALYAGAKAFVFASLYEGFGLPPLEAMASGVPVLVSNRGAMPEIASGAACMIDPDRPDDTARAIEALLEDSRARNTLIERGLARASTLTWRACARATMNVYRSVATDDHRALARATSPMANTKA